MVRLEELPNDILELISQRLTQVELIRLNRVNRNFYQIFTPYLYKQIYVTETKGKCCKWSVIQYDLGTGGLHRFERSLGDNRALGKYVKKLVSDDIKFILFKLNNWQNRYGFKLRYFKFGRVPYNHFHTGYDDILKLYTKNKWLRNVQVSRIEDLAKLASDHITELELVIVDFKHHFFPRFQRLVQVAERLEKLEINSKQNAGLMILKQFESYGIRFPDLKQLTFNHCHGAMNDMEYDMRYEIRLDSCKLNKLFSENLDTLKIACGCMHGSKYKLEEIHEYTQSQCQCVGAVLEQIAWFPIKTLEISRLGSSIMKNAFGIIEWKTQVAKYLPRVAISKLTLDSNCQLYPPQLFDQCVLGVQQMKRCNDRLIKTINQRELTHLSIPDYYESMLIWMQPEIDIKDDSILRFLQTNEKIQYYLNPLLEKHFVEYKNDLIGCVLQLLKNKHQPNQSVPSGLSSITEPSATNPKPNHEFESRQVSSGLVPPLHPPASLHDIFRHDTYKNLVNYQFCENLMASRKWVIEGTGTQVKISPSCHSSHSSHSSTLEIACHCDGLEFDRVVAFLQHMLHPFSGNKVVLNNLNRYTTKK